MISRLFSPFVVGVGCRIFGQIISFVTIVLASRYLDLAGFGTYAVAWAAAVIASAFIYTGLYHAFLRSPDIEADSDTLFWLKLGVGALGAAVLLAASTIAGGGGSQVGHALALLAALPLISAPVAWNEAQLLRAQRARAASVYTALSELCALGAVLFGLRMGYGIAALIAGRYVAALVSLAVTSALVRTSPQFRFRREAVRRGFATALPLWGSTGVGMFSNYGVDLILAGFLNPAAVGAYRSGARIAMTASQIVAQPLHMLSWSRFSRLERENNLERLAGAWRGNMALSAAIIWPVMISVTLLAHQLVVTVFGASWLQAASVLSILAVSKSVGVLHGLLEPTMTCLDRPGVVLKLRLLGAGLLLVLLLTVGHSSAEAAAWSHLAMTTFIGALSFHVMLSGLRIGWLSAMKTFLPAAFLTTLCLATILLIGDGSVAIAPGRELVVTLCTIAGVWLLSVVLLLKTRVLEFPST